MTYTEEDIEKISEGVDTVVEIIDNKSTTEIPEQLDEQTIEAQETESEAFEEQGKIAYNGSDSTPNVQTGEYAGLTYYSQVDARWKNKRYSSIGDNSQTIGSSGCGPSCGAMVVSSIRGTITPDTMADLYAQYGYRSANSGTYWSAFKWTADVFDMDYKETSNVDTAIELLKDNNLVVVACGQGLFTYGGHFITIVGIEGEKLKIYDPYLYSTKFTTSTRKGKATVEGNTVYVTIENFKKYANANKFFCFKNDRQDKIDNTTTVVTIKEEVRQFESYKAKVKVNSVLNIRSGANTNYTRVGYYKNTEIVTILAESNGWGKTDKGWICLDYITKTINTYPNKLIKYRQRNEYVKQIQAELINEGYKLQGGADGVFGKYTLAVVKKFQKDNKITVDGIVGKVTWGKLF